MRRFGSVATVSTAAIEAGILQHKQYQTSLAAIASEGIATPIGFWDWDRDNVEAVTGGAGYDFTWPGSAGGTPPVFSYADGTIGSDAVYGAYFNGVSNGETNNEAVWKMPSASTDVSASVFIRPDWYDGVGDTQEQGIIGYYHRSSFTLAATTYPTYMLWLEPLRNNNSFQPRVGYYDSGGAFVSVGWETGGGEPIGLRIIGWYQIGFTRTRNGVNDVDLALYVNGIQVASLTGQNDTGDPTSVNMRLIPGARFSSGDNFNGTMRDLAIWDEAISAGDMLSMFNIGTGQT